MTTSQPSVDAPPLLDLGVLHATFPRPLEQLPSPDWRTGLLRERAEAPVSRGDATKTVGRDLPRHGGYKPVDLDCVTPPLRAGIVQAEDRDIFNASGQEIRLGGLLCLHDAERQPAHQDPRWHHLAAMAGVGTNAGAGHTAATLRRYRALHERAGPMFSRAGLLVLLGLCSSCASDPDPDPDPVVAKAEPAVAAPTERAHTALTFDESVDDDVRP